MKRLFVAIALAGVAMFALAGTASADVPRYQFQTATFTVTEPADAYDQWVNVWTHNYTVAVNPCDNTFTGTAPAQTKTSGGSEGTGETITGSFGDGTISFTATRTYDGRTWTLTDATYGDIHVAVTVPSVAPNEIDMKVTEPVFTNTSSYKNHGQYVKEQGSDVAHSCIGMPIPEVPFTWSQNGIVAAISMTGTDVQLPMAGTYRIDVLGEWTNTPFGWVDAEYTDNGAGGYADGFDRNSWLLGPDFGDLQVNGQFVDWGAYSSGHAYTLAMALSGTVNLAIFDGQSGAKVPGWYTDNTGSLGFTITYVSP